MSDEKSTALTGKIADANRLTIGTGSKVSIGGKTYTLKDPSPKGCGWWFTEDGQEIDVAGASNEDTLENVKDASGTETWDREKAKKLTAQYEGELKQLTSQKPGEK